MNENINLCEILKGHEGETFWSPLYGNVRLLSASYSMTFPIRIEEMDETRRALLLSNGHYSEHDEGECMIFPSKDQRDWNKWLEEQKPKVPKTWSELVKSDIGDIVGYEIEVFYRERPQSLDYTPIEKSAKALLKIHQLIEVGYGGNVTKEEIGTPIEKYAIIHDGKRFIINRYLYGFYHISFHTKEQAEEFLSYPDNIQLLKNYFQI